ncbi:hypothetical protein K488DRAFT_55600 [Vararia minispora EC-137]|uniref:Uncharacterized protein n=1 Tax=Vararia minispora EC-137 TaxID=1314806 RepID=A0ACB8QDB5_9AGAM|nr:hypothetical protein K488DRAFT_55600 [Vararia minispora EC-137]
MNDAGIRCGIDVGGTNTDGVLLDPRATDAPNCGILAYHKSPTTPNPSDGIEECIRKLLEEAKVDASQVASLTIGTTHFINAVIEKDSARLAPVAVIRLCGPFSRECYPGIDWPSDLASLICAHVGFVDGGLEIDGDIIRDVVEEQVAEQCRIIREKGINAVVVNGIFAPSDLVEKQEERVGEWVAKYLPQADVVLSKHVANLGFIERENAALLNASILPFARATIASFERAARTLRLRCPVFLTQNDGTLLPAALAGRVPIRTFNSGPTNSMCGAAFLVRHELGASTVARKALLVADVGGTTTDVGMLLVSGLPRQAAAVTDVAGIRMNFSCPDVKRRVLSSPPTPRAIGLGGGSIVRKAPGQPLSIGPDSVGLRIQTSALVFGGAVPTATDYAVAASAVDLAIGDAARVPNSVRADVEEYRAVLKAMLEGIIDRMKTNADDIDVLLVGGGAVLVEDGTKLKGASKVIKPKYSGVANAIVTLYLHACGAAIARVSGTVDTVRPTTDKTTQQVLDEVSQMAVERAVENGARRETVELAEIDVIPVPYVANKARVIVKAIGDFDFSRPPPSAATSADLDAASAPSAQPIDKRPLDRLPTSAPPADTVETLEAYRPHVSATREWKIAERDLEWISLGCYILGTGGGGTPYPDFVRVREMMRRGATVRVISVDDLPDDARVGCGGGMGSPTVSIEKLSGDEMIDAQRAVYAIVGGKPDAFVLLEIGGGNGLQGFLLGASCNMDVPTVDGDWMGRAYPTGWQTTPIVLGGDGAKAMPNAISDGNGNVMNEATSEKMVERAFRAALAEMGSMVGFAKAPFTGKETKAWAVRNTVSLSWRIGRAVALCRARSEMDAVADVIVDAVGGPDTARVLFRGKIVAVERKLIKGHVYGEVTIAGADGTPFAGAALKIPFKNENLVATRVGADGTETVLASVPDLISVSDAASGEALGTPDYRYGLHVFVLGITAAEQWTSTARGIALGGPAGFGLDLEYVPLGVFKAPRSVIDEYAPQ